MLLYKKIVAHDFRYDPRKITYQMVKYHVYCKAQILKEVLLKIQVFLYVMLCSLMNSY